MTLSAKMAHYLRYKSMADAARIIQIVRWRGLRGAAAQAVADRIMLYFVEWGI